MFSSAKIKIIVIGFVNLLVLCITMLFIYKDCNSLVI